MLKRQIDLTRPLRCVRYGRMSNDQQNPRSPDQQFDEIACTIKRQRFPWTIQRDYRDDGISGRYLRKRLGFQQMLRDIRAGLIKVDAILVDTWERFGRADELAQLRQELWTKHGVLILTANTGFADPTTESGKVVSMFEQARALHTRSWRWLLLAVLVPLMMYAACVGLGRPVVIGRTTKSIMISWRA